MYGKTTNKERKKIRQRITTMCTDAELMVQLFDGTIYIYVGTVSEKQPPNLGLKNMSRS